MPKLTLATKLLKLYDEDVERVGFVLPNDKIVEVKNIHENPSKAFMVSDEDVMKYGDQCIATWHTHAKASKNLSAVDMKTFLVWDNVDHYIIGNNGVQKYTVKDGEVFLG